MNYVLQVVRGRSATDDAQAGRWRHQSRAPRRLHHPHQVVAGQPPHCELFDAGGKLTVADLGSSNGTFVNGKRVIGQQTLKVGDELTVGRGDPPRGHARPAGRRRPPHPPAGKPGDTAVVEAVAVDADEEEFEIEFDEGEPRPTSRPSPWPKSRDPEPRRPPEADVPRKPPRRPRPPRRPAAKPAGKGEDEAVAQFLLDLNLDDE